jgi:hypothetical protein
MTKEEFENLKIGDLVEFCNGNDYDYSIMVITNTIRRSDFYDSYSIENIVGNDIANVLTSNCINYCKKLS